MSAGRILRHLMQPAWTVRRAFPAHSLEAIRGAIAQSEAGHTGEIRFAVEHALDLRGLLRNLSARERAIDVFSQLRVWDTEHNNGVLIYLLLADRDVEIVADRGIHARVGSQGWEAICRGMEAAFGAGRFEAGVLDGIQAIGEHLRRHFPSAGGGENELPDRPVVL
jgi:uncharacterized membrane protein